MMPIMNVYMDSPNRNTFLLLRRGITSACLLIFFTLFVPTNFYKPAMAASPIATENKSLSAVILAYHRIDEDLYPDTSLSFEQFQIQIDYLQSQNYNIMPLSSVIHALKNQTPLPEKTVSITFEGGYSSAYRKAIPLLLKRGLPFTVFYPSEAVQMKNPDYLSLSDLKTLQQYNFVDIGILPARHSHLYLQDDRENLRLLNKAIADYQTIFNERPSLFSYPYGEYTARYKMAVKDRNFQAAIGIHSGAISPESDFNALPRFSITEGYGDIERFAIIVNARPYPAHDIEPDETLIEGTKPPSMKLADPGLLSLGFTVSQEKSSLLEQTNCFLSGNGRIQFEVIGSQRAEIRQTLPQNDNRVRLTCTAPISRNAWETGESGEAGTTEQQWYWLGRLLVYPPAAIEKQRSSVNKGSALSPFKNNRPAGPR